MKVLMVGHSDSLGGAARAAYRLHNALLLSGMESRMIVNHSTSGDWRVTAPETLRQKIRSRIAPHAAQLLCKLQRTSNPIMHSPAVFPSPWVSAINDSDADIVHLHWVAGEMLSVADIGRIQKPVVWTLHDMWGFCGAEHHSDKERWRQGYDGENRPTDERGLDLNRWTWARKKRAWIAPIQIVTPSQWLATCVAESALMCKWPVAVIGNALNTDDWKPIDKITARGLLGIAEGRPTVAFGAWGVEQTHKGFDLLLGALGHLRESRVDLQLVVFGQCAPKEQVDVGYPIKYLGHLSDDLSLRATYSAADVMVVPSRAESFGQTASEALACGTPVVAFNCTGLKDIVDHESTGYLARPFDPRDLARGIGSVVAVPERLVALSKNARTEAVRRYSYPVIAAKYRMVYDSVLARTIATSSRIEC